MVENNQLIQKFKESQKAQKEEARLHMLDQLAKSREFKEKAV